MIDAVLSVGHDGKMGSASARGPTALPVWQTTPPRPANAMAGAEAWIGHQPPPAGKVGFLYMLATGSDAILFKLIVLRMNWAVSHSRL